MLFAKFVFTFSKLTHWSLLVVKSLLIRCNIHSLQIIALSCSKIHLLLVAENYSLLIAKSHSLLVAKCACYLSQKLLDSKSTVTCCKIHSILVAEVINCNDHSFFVVIFACFPFQIYALLATFCRICSLQKYTRHSLWNSHRGSIVYLNTKMLDETFGFLKHNLFPKAKKLVICSKQTY